MKIILLVLSSLLIALTAIYFFNKKESEISPKEFVLNWGERMKNSPNGGPGRNCFPTAYSVIRYPELKEELLEAKKLNLFHPDQSGNGLLLMCAEKTGGFNLVNYRHSTGVYHEQ